MTSNEIWNMGAKSPGALGRLYRRLWCGVRGHAFTLAYMAQGKRFVSCYRCGATQRGAATPPPPV